MKLYNSARAPNGKRVNEFLAARGLAVDGVRGLPSAAAIHQPETIA